MTNAHTNTNSWHIHAEDFPWQGASDDRLKFLLQYAVLAPSAYNTQPWAFAVEKDTIRVFTDMTRWLPAVDTDQHDIHLSVGCALENLLIAAAHFGYRWQVEYFPDPNHPMLAALVRLEGYAEKRTPRADPLFEAILRRSTDHHPFSVDHVPSHLLHRLAECAATRGTVLSTITDHEIRQQIDALIFQADAEEFADPARRKVMAYCIQQGVFDTDWLLSKLARFANRLLHHESRQNKEELEILKGAPVLGILASEAGDRTTQIKVGQVFERIFLTAVSLGLRVEPITHVLQAPQNRAALAALPSIKGLIPQILFRLGLEEVEIEHTLRRPLEDVLLESIPVQQNE